MAWFDTDNLRNLLAEETDADSPVSEAITIKLRENFEALLMMLFYTGVNGSLTSDPPNDDTGVLTDSTKSFSLGEHTDHTILILTGGVAGNFYQITATDGTTLTIGGGELNAYAEGLRSGDTYYLLYEIISPVWPMAAHDHDKFNSAAVSTFGSDFVVTASITDLAVTNDKLGADAVTTDEISTNTITSGDMSATLESGSIRVTDQEDTNYYYTITRLNGVITSITRTLIV